MQVVMGTARLEASHRPQKAGRSSRGSSCPQASVHQISVFSTNQRVQHQFSVFSTIQRVQHQSVCSAEAGVAAAGRGVGSSAGRQPPRPGRGAGWRGWWRRRRRVHREGRFATLGDVANLVVVEADPVAVGQRIAQPGIGEPEGIIGGGGEGGGVVRHRICTRGDELDILLHRCRAHLDGRMAAREQTALRESGHGGGAGVELPLLVRDRAAAAALPSAAVSPFHPQQQGGVYELQLTWRIEGPGHVVLHTVAGIAAEQQLGRPVLQAGQAGRQAGRQGGGRRAGSGRWWGMPYGSPPCRVLAAGHCSAACAAQLQPLAPSCVGPEHGKATHVHALLGVVGGHSAAGHHTKVVGGRACMFPGPCR